ncbi:MAG: protein kinase [Nibricoccus sp.]
MQIPSRCPQCGAEVAGNAVQGLCPRCLLAINLCADTLLTQNGSCVAAEPLSLTEVSRLFPNLEILRLIGRGGMGAVYQARQPSLDRHVALKLLTPPAGDTRGFSERFTREARALARLTHGNIVAVHDFGEQGGHYFLLMEFVDGVTLRDLIEDQGITPPKALAIVPKICEALQYAHEQGVVHRDIKPENILVDRRGEVKIADFGIAKIINPAQPPTHLTGAHDRIGTPHYMAPEQVEGSKSVDHRADIYSLGVVFYELLTGELPLGRFAPPSRKVQIDVRLDEVVLRSLEKEPERRFQRAADVKTRVETIVASPKAEEKPSVGIRRRRVITNAIAAGAVIALAVAAAVYDRNKRSTTETANSTLEDAQPVVVQTSPVSGATAVEAGETLISVSFSKPMDTAYTAWSAAWADSTPKLVSPPYFDSSRRTVYYRVILQSGRVYGLMFNGGRHRDLRDPSGNPSLPYLLTFETQPTTTSPAK